VDRLLCDAQITACLPHATVFHGRSDGGHGGNVPVHADVAAPVDLYLGPITEDVDPEEVADVTFDLSRKGTRVWKTECEVTGAEYCRWRAGRAQRKQRLHLGRGFSGKTAVDCVADRRCWPGLGAVLLHCLISD
jgi:hypothetical protein